MTIPEIHLDPRRIATLAAYNCPDCSFDAVHRIQAQNIAPAAKIAIPGVDGVKGTPVSERVRNLFFYDRCFSCGFGQLTGRPGSPGNPDAGEWGVIATVHDWEPFPQDKKTMWMRAFNEVLDRIVEREKETT